MGLSHIISYFGRIFSKHRVGANEKWQKRFFLRCVQHSKYRVIFCITSEILKQNLFFKLFEICVLVNQNVYIFEIPIL